MSDRFVPGWFHRQHASLHARFDAIDRMLIRLSKEITMSGASLSQQLDDVTASIRADVAAVSAEVTALLAGVTPGSTITQAQVDALTAIDASLKAIPAPPAA